MEFSSSEEENRLLKRVGKEDFVWTDYLLSRFPNQRIPHLPDQPILGAILFSFVVWLTGVAASAGSGSALDFVGSVPTYGFIFLFIPASMIGTKYFHESFRAEAKSFTSHVELGKDKLDVLRRRLDLLLGPRIAFVFIAFLGILFLSLFDENLTSIVQLIAIGRPGLINAALAWSLGLSSLIWLLFATIVWIASYIWIGVFLLSRQPLHFVPTRYSNEFGPLAMINLKVTGFWLLGLTITALFGLLRLFFANARFQILFQFLPFFILMAPAILGFLLPHYNIYRTLRVKKGNALRRIDKRQRSIIGMTMELEKTDLFKLKDPTEYARISSQFISLTSALIALKAQEDRVRDARDWPLDHSMLTVFLSFVIIPMSVNLLSRLLL